jgi:hypothetical protein
MLCQKCGRTKATVHREFEVFRQKVQEHLCPLCAGEGSIDWPMPRKPPLLPTLPGEPPSKKSILDYAGKVHAFMKTDAFQTFLADLFTEEERSKLKLEVSHQGFRLGGDRQLAARLSAALRAKFG